MLKWQQYSGYKWSPESGENERWEGVEWHVDPAPHIVPVRPNLLSRPTGL